NITAAGKIHVQLHAKQHGGGYQVGAAHSGRVAVDQRHILGKVVGNDHFFGVAPQHAECAARAAVVAETPASLDLRPQVGVPLTGAVDQRGEKADEQRIVERVELDAAAALEYVDGIAQRGKRKIAQAQRGQQVFAPR